MSDRFRAGIPDTYVPGGIWIEAKVIPVLPTRITPPIRYLTGPQKTELEELTEHGDTCFVALYFAFDHHSKAFALVPWWEFQRIADWNLDTISSLGLILDKSKKEDFQLERFFNKDHPLKYDASIWWNDAFDKWVKRYPEKFDPERTPGQWPRALKGDVAGYMESDDDEDHEPGDSDEEDGAD